MKIRHLLKECRPKIKRPVTESGFEAGPVMIVPLVTGVGAEPNVLSGLEKLTHFVKWPYFLM